ncbi:14762_t:CDS:2, partial [Gigaspora rosea]
RSKFYCHKFSICDTTNTGINLADRKITNHSARLTAIMLLKASDIPEDELIFFQVIDHARASAIEEDLEEYYNYPRKSYFTYESEEEYNIET